MVRVLNAARIAIDTSFSVPMITVGRRSLRAGTFVRSLDKKPHSLHRNGHPELRF